MVFLTPAQVYSCDAQTYCVTNGKQLERQGIRSLAFFDILDPNSEKGRGTLKNIRACFDVHEDTEVVVDFDFEMERVERGLAVFCTGTALIPRLQ